MDKYKRKRKIRKIKRQILTILFAPYFIIHYLFTKLWFYIKPFFGSKSKLNNIVNGWSNYLVEDAAVEEVALKRAKICSTCPFAVEMNIKIADKKLKDVKGLKCGKCNCPLSAKTRSMNDRCPVGKW